MWRIACSVEEEALDIFMPVLELFSPTISFFEQENDPRWCLEALCETQPDLETITSQFKALAADCQIFCPVLSIEKLPEKDWLAENRQAFPPIHVGRFYIHGAHITSPPPLKSLTLQIEAATAFGTGEHATTHGCLVALEELHTFYAPKAALDMGCGSGILAMAMAKLWPNTEIIGVDNDPEAVRVAIGNCVINQVHQQVTCLFGEGFKTLLPQKSFDLITANILADSLIHMAEDLSHYLNLEGFVILSGILASQAKSVLKAYQHQGFTLHKDYLKNEWAILVLQKMIL